MTVATSIDPTEYVRALEPWMSAQRWFTGKSHVPQLSLLGRIVLESSGDDVIVIALVRDRGGADPVLYAVPLIESPADNADDSDTGAASVARVGDMRLADAIPDARFAASVIRLIETESRAGADDVEARGVVIRPDAVDVVTDVRVLTGEQSNTSIVVSLRDQPEVVLKVFRTLHDGENPDVVLQSALTEAGSDRVPVSVGSVVLRWPLADSGATATGHLAYVQRFVSGARDLWAVALDEAAVDTPPDALAVALGHAVAEVHTGLAHALPTREATESDRVQFHAVWRGRLAAAQREVPELVESTDAVEAAYAAAQAGSWPRLQRIHGDLHLGQVLRGGDGRIYLIDFEGEPLRSLAERVLPDLTLRDVAGVLRSFDYVAGTLGSTAEAVRWADRARSRFLDAYAERAELDVESARPLLDALELDKALYEVVYEARNRPSWLPIPLAAVRRLTERG